MYRIKRAAAVLLLLILVFGLPVYADSELIPDGEITDSGINYKTCTAEKRDFYARVTTTGAGFMQSVSILTYSGMNAFFEEMLVKNGDQVEKGDPVMRIHTEVSESAVYEAELAVQRLNEEKGRNRTEAFENIAIYSRKQGQAETQAERDVYALRIRKEQELLAKKNYESDMKIRDAGERLDKLNEARELQYVYADVSGRISDLQIFEENAMITEGMKLMTINVSDTRMIVINSDQYHYGMEVNLKLELSGAKFEGKGRVVAAPSAVKSGVNTQTIIELQLTDEEEQQMDRLVREVQRRGGDLTYMLRTLNVNGVAVVKDVIVLDRDCRATEKGKNYLRVVDDEGYVRKRLYMEGGSNLDEIWIIDGVTEGERVMITND